MKVVIDKAQSGNDVVISILDNKSIILKQVIIDNLPEKDGIIIYEE